jgi:hypothetical protein
MTSYVPGGSAALAGQGADTLQTVELRVLSNLIQQQSGSASPDELRVLRNDQAFELGIVPPVIAGN